MVMRKMTNKKWDVSDKSKTPDWILDIFRDYFDPCPLTDKPKFDGLTIKWKKYNYVNPPYSDDKTKWIQKAIDEMENGNVTVMLLPHVPDAIWYFDLVVPNAKILGLRGRLQLDNGKHPRYSTMLAIFYPKKNPR